jgi:hypothetical protein
MMVCQLAWITHCDGGCGREVVELVYVSILHGIESSRRTDELQEIAWNCKELRQGSAQDSIQLAL